MVEYRSGGRRVFLINHPDAAGHVLAREQHRYANPPHPYAKLDSHVTPEGAFLLRLGSGPEAAADGQRRLRRVCEISAARAEEWLSAFGSEERAVDVLPGLKEMMLRALVEALFGIPDPEGTAAFAAAVARSEEILAGSPGLPSFGEPGPPPADLPGAVREQEGFVERLIVRKGWPRTAGFRTAVLRTILNSYNGPATALAWTLLLLAEHPDVQERLRAEADRASGELSGLVQTRAAILEAMRLYPPAWMLGRSALVEDDVLGTRIPAGAPVFVSPYTMHRHPALWPEPKRFDPGRFSAARAQGRHRYAYLPFGGGARRCTAAHAAVQQLQAVLAAILRRVEVRPDPARPARPRPLISLRPGPGAFLRIRPRGESGFGGSPKVW